MPSLMGQGPMTLLYAGLAIGAFLLVTGLGQVLRRGETGSEARNRRMRMIDRGATTAEVLALLKPPEARGPLARLPVVGNLPAALRQAGFRVSAPTFAGATAAAAILAAMLGVLLGGPLAALALGAATGLLPLAVVAARRTARLQAMTAQLPDALDLLARGLKVGHPLSASITTVAREMADPVGSEFGLICDQVSYGDDLVEAFREFADRTGIEDVRYLAASIAIQHGTGGDLARVIDILSRVIRGRLAMRRRIKAITSEGRLSGWFLSALPLLILGATTLTSPAYFSGVADDPLFRPMMAAIATLVALNALVLRRLVNFRI